MNSIYTIKTITNLHVGSGDINFDIIDNQVQKDNSKLPIIHGSSLKGALREHFENKWGKNNEKINHIFGKEGDDGAGNYSFFEATILTLPLRSNVKPYFNVISPLILQKFIENLKLFDTNNQHLKELENFYNQIKNFKEDVIIFENINTDVYLEDYKAVVKQHIQFPSLFKNLAIVSDEIFLAIELPTIARNALDDNGKSKNLWYEEIVPKEALFYTTIIKNDTYKEEFDKVLTNDIIQIGANKSIGYGFCRFQRV